MAGTGGPSFERLCGAAAAAAGYGWEAPGLGKGGAVDGPGGEWQDAAPRAGHPGALVFLGGLGGLGGWEVGGLGGWGVGGLGGWEVGRLGGWEVGGLGGLGGLGGWGVGRLGGWGVGEKLDVCFSFGDVKYVHVFP